MKLRRNSDDTFSFSTETYLDETFGSDETQMELSALELNVLDQRRTIANIKATLDSGAAVCVMPKSWTPEYRVIPSPASEKGQEYKAAGGQKLKDLGDRRLSVKLANGKKCMLRTSVADVHKMLLSVSKVVDAGNIVHFSQESNYIENKKTGARTKVTRENDVYVLEFEVLEPKGVDSLRASSSGNGRP